VRSVARYPEVREDGALWVPLAPPPAPTYRQLSRESTGIVGRPAIVSYSTEWLLNLRVLTEPCQQHTDKSRWVVELCDEEAWHVFRRHSTRPARSERLVASVRLVFLVETI
jgi:hypothetical protein